MRLPPPLARNPRMSPSAGEYAGVGTLPAVMAGNREEAGVLAALLSPCLHQPG